MVYFSNLFKTHPFHLECVYPKHPPLTLTNTILTARVVQFDHFMSKGTSQADLVVRTENTDKPEYLRLRYAPEGWGFDAPSATQIQLHPQEVFTNPNLVWTFSTEEPRNDEEKAACSGGASYIQENSDGAKTEINPYERVPGSIGGEPSNPRSLHCLVLKSWFADAGRLVGPCRIQMDKVLTEASFIVVYKFDAENGVPKNITKAYNNFLSDETFLHCISHWVVTPMQHGYAEFRHERDAGWTSMTVTPTESQKQ